jgi:hypothetical protein
LLESPDRWDHPHHAAPAGDGGPVRRRAAPLLGDRRRFDAEALRWLPHYLDPQLLRTDLLQSVFYLHSRPPVFNLFLAGLVKLFPGHVEAAGRAVYLALGALLYVALVGNSFEVGENNRFRFVTEPLCFVRAGLFVHHGLLPRVAALRARRYRAA